MNQKPYSRTVDKKNLLKSQGGQGLVETLVGALIISISALGLGISLTQSAKARIKTQSVSNAIAMESEIVSKMQDSSVFAGQEENLRTGNLSAFRSTFVLTIEGWDPIRIGQQYFTADGASCDGFEQSSCVMKVQLEIRQTVGGATPQYALGYRIEINSATVAMAAMGASQPTFQDADYDMIVPVDVYREGTSCPAGTIVARGFNMDTGQIECLREPTAVCPPNNLATGLTLVGDAIEFVCTPLVTASCSFPYAPAQINPASLLGGSPSGSCLFIATRSLPARTGPTYGRLPIINASAAYGVSGSFCPSGYLARVVQCDAVVMNTPNLPTPPVGAAMPAGQWQGVEAGNVLVDPVNVGTTLRSETGTSAACRLNNDPSTQPGLAGNKAGWTGHVNMAVQCVVDPATYPLHRPVGG